MRGKISLLAGGAIGYVLGTRAGRERYEEIVAQAQSFWNNPKVQEKASAAQDLAKEKAPIIADKVSSDTKPSSSTSPADHQVGGLGETGDGLGGGVQGTAPYPTSATTGLG